MNPHVALGSDRRRWALAVLLVPLATLLIFIVLVGLSARGLSLGDISAGSIRISDATLRRNDPALWYLSASAVIDLPEPIRDGLDSGVPLDFIVMLKLEQPRRLWPDRTLLDHRHRLRLSYYELTRHYRVQVVDTDISRNFRSLSAALAGLGDIARLPVPMVDDPQVRDLLQSGPAQGEAAVVAVLDFRLDSNALPLPLQPLIASSWRLSSQEFRWPVH